jgi:hypothetical protein
MIYMRKEKVALIQKRTYRSNSLHFFANYFPRNTSGKQWRGGKEECGDKLRLGRENEEGLED